VTEDIAAGRAAKEDAMTKRQMEWVKYHHKWLKAAKDSREQSALSDKLDEIEAKLTEDEIAEARDYHHVRYLPARSSERIVDRRRMYTLAEAKEMCKRQSLSSRAGRALGRVRKRIGI